MRHLNLRAEWDMTAILPNAHAQKKHFVQQYGGCSGKEKLQQET